MSDYIEADEKALRDVAVSGHYFHRRLYDYERDMPREEAEAKLSHEAPVFALIREWCGQELVQEYDERKVLRLEVERLRGQVESIAKWLEDNGQSEKASMVLQELDPASKAGHPRTRRKPLLWQS